MEVLTAYSHISQLADLQRCVSARRLEEALVAPPAFTRPSSLRERLNERTRADMIATYRAEPQPRRSRPRTG